MKLEPRHAIAMALIGAGIFLAAYNVTDKAGKPGIAAVSGPEVAARFERILTAAKPIHTIGMGLAVDDPPRRSDRLIYMPRIFLGIQTGIMELNEQIALARPKLGSDEERQVLLYFERASKTYSEAVGVWGAAIFRENPAVRLGPRKSREEIEKIVLDYDVAYYWNHDHRRCIATIFQAANQEMETAMGALSRLAAGE